MDTLKIAAQILGSRRMVLTRELTKLHEEILSGTAADLLETLSAREVIKGEIVIVVEGAASPHADIALDDVVKTLIKEGFSGKRLADEAHKRFGVKKSAAYEKFLALKKSK
jgi:16S rRNA (cytidine1402-2'-O)-methyltransferase